MKTKASLITIFVISFFLVSLTAISISLAKSQQNERLPDSQQPPPRTGVPTAEPAKSKFWDLEVDKVIINGQSISYPYPSGPNPVIQVKVGDTVHCTCYYTINTTPIMNITASDAKHWGSGNLSYKIVATIFEFPDTFSQEWKILERKLPKFTYEDVKNWKPLHLRLSNKTRKTWTSYLEYNWIATVNYAGNKNILIFTFWVDDDNTIKETNEYNNGNFGGDKTVARILVIP